MYVLLSRPHNFVTVWIKDEKIFFFFNNNNNNIVNCVNLQLNTFGAEISLMPIRTGNRSGRTGNCGVTD